MRCSLFLFLCERSKRRRFLAGGQENFIKPYLFYDKYKNFPMFSFTANNSIKIVFLCCSEKIFWGAILYKSGFIKIGFIY